MHDTDSLRLVLALLVAPLALSLAGCGDVPQGAVVVGSPAPDFAAPTLAGDTISLANLRGEVVLLNIWATWCAPCREEMPDLQWIEDEFGDREFRVIGVSIDQAHADGAVARFLEDHAIDFLVLRDPRSVSARRFRTIGVPESFLIDRQGVLAARWIGQVDRERVAGAILEAL
jgi:cytochrome c biogenesis protein CcmG, thiol:disulfide interchange protein DsbE